MRLEGLKEFGRCFEDMYGRRKKEEDGIIWKRRRGFKNWQMSDE